MPAEHFSCPQCSAELRWSQETAGVEVRCASCTSVVRVPDLPASNEPVESYDLDLDNDTETSTHDLVDDLPASVNHGGKCPKCNCKLADNVVICMNCGIDLRTGQAISTIQQADSDSDTSNAPKPGAPIAPVTKAAKRAAQREAAAAALANEHHRKEFKVPLILSGIGLMLALCNAFLFTPFVASTLDLPVMPEIVIYWIKFVVNLLVSVPTLLISLFIIARIFGAAYGELVTALLKLVAIVLVASEIDYSVGLTLDWLTGGFGGIGFLLQASVNLFVFFSLVMWLFESDVMEVFALWLVSKALLVGTALVILGFFLST